MKFLETLTRNLTSVSLCIGAFFVPGFADGLSGEYLVTSRWRSFQETYSPLTNPALSVQANYPMLASAYCQTLGGSFTLWEAIGILPLGLNQSIGVSWLGTSSGKFAGAQFDPSTNTIIEGPAIKSTEGVFIGTYGLKLGSHLAVGANAVFVNQSLFGLENRFSIPPGIDAGATFSATPNKSLGTHLIGINFQNLVAPVLASSDAASNDSILKGDIFARDVRLLWLGHFFENQLGAKVTVDVKDLFKADKATEWLSLQGGNPELDIAGGVDWTFAGLAKLSVEASNVHWSTGLGLDMSRFNKGKALEIAYQFGQLYGNFMTSQHTVYMRIDVGTSRVDWAKNQKAKALSAKPDDLYNKAMALYAAGKYWDAMFVFGLIQSRFPMFFKTDWVRYYFHSSQDRMDMRTAASSGLKAAVSRFPQSKMVYWAHLALLEIAYHNDDRSDISKYFTLLSTNDVPDSIKYHASYLRGESFMREKKYPMAIVALGNIPPEHPDYRFAQVSRGIAYAINESSVESSETAFLAAAEGNPSTPAEKEIKNKALVLLGFLNYERGTFLNAITSLRHVSSSSRYFAEAQIGLGWTLIAGRQWSDCVNAGKAAMNASNNAVVQNEGRLIAAYGAYKLEDYAQALQLINDALRVVDSLKPPSREAFARKKRDDDVLRETYDDLAKSAETFALTSDAAREFLGDGTLDSMHTVQKESVKQFHDFLDYSDQYKEGVIFSRGIERVQTDIKFLAAAVSKKMLTKENNMDNDIKKVQKLNDQIEELKKNIDDKAPVAP